MSTHWKECYRVPSIDLRPPYLAEVQRLLHVHVPQAEVWAFGSRVTGAAHDASDLDLVLRDPAHLEQPMQELAQLCEALR